MKSHTWIRGGVPDVDENRYLLTRGAHCRSDSGHVIALNFLRHFSTPLILFTSGNTYQCVISLIVVVVEGVSNSTRSGSFDDLKAPLDSPDSGE